jgi:thiamine kinase-like enzyme
MEKFFQDFVLDITGGESITHKEQVQSLWSGYGEIIRLSLKGASVPTVIAKWVLGETDQPHPRGWKNNIGHERKVRSYVIEKNWYQEYSTITKARKPFYYGSTERFGKTLIVLEDLNAAGYPLRLEEINTKQIENCIAWLAQFHADFMQTKPLGLWEIGTYWHLDTRPQEWEAISDLSLKNAAESIDQKLRDSSYKTLVHGDAKLANFCFGNHGQVAGLDFQYVGGGCGMKDLAYFIGSCLKEEECEQQEEAILNFYFKKLGEAMDRDISEIEKEWRPLYRVAWADFYRFLKGWSPQHWKINSYSERIINEVIANL